MGGGHLEDEIDILRVGSLFGLFVCLFVFSIYIYFLGGVRVGFRLVGFVGVGVGMWVAVAPFFSGEEGGGGAVGFRIHAHVDTHTRTPGKPKLITHSYIQTKSEPEPPAHETTLIRTYIYRHDHTKQNQNRA